MEYENYLPPLLTLVCIVGLLTNGALMFILAKTNVGNVPNTLILNLAVADLLVLVFNLPFTAAAHAMGSYQFGEFVCKMAATVSWVAVGVSAFTLTAMCAHSLVDGRDTTATLPSSRSKRIRGVGVLWATAIVLAVSTLAYAHVWQSHDGVKSISYCVPSSREAQNVELPVRFAVYVAIPLAAVAYFYCVWRQNRTGDFQNRAQKDFSNVVLVLVVVYAICFIPFYAVHIWIVFYMRDYDGVVHVLASIASFLTIAYRCLNPVAIYCASDAFRKLFNRYLLCCCSFKTRDSAADHELP